MNIEEVIAQAQRAKDGERDLIGPMKEQATQNILKHVDEDHLNEIVNKARRDGDFAVFFATVLGRVVTSIVVDHMIAGEPMDKVLEDIQYTTMVFTGIVYVLGEQGYLEREEE